MMSKSPVTGQKSHVWGTQGYGDQVLQPYIQSLVPYSHPGRVLGHRSTLASAAALSLTQPLNSIL